MLVCNVFGSNQLPFSNFDSLQYKVEQCSHNTTVYLLAVDGK